MPTRIEEMRLEAQEARERVRAERARYDEDNLPTLEDVAKLEALVNAEAELADNLRKIEGVLAMEVAPRASSNGRRNPATRPEPVGEPRDLRSLGERFVSGDQYTSWLNANAPSGRLIDGRVAPSAPLQFEGLRGLEQHAALITGDSSTSAGAFVVNERTPIYNQLGRRPLDVLDIIRVLPTSSDLVEFVRQTSRTNAAAGVAEATATSGSSGVKPESDATFEVVQTPVKTIANWLAATRQAIADAPQLRGIIDTELRDNLREELEEQVIAGSGGAGFTGIFNTTNTQTQAWSTDILTTTRKARTLVRTVGRATPTAYVLSPTDWETIDLLQDNEARYFFGGPMAMGTPRLWGLPVVESESVPSGYGLVGDFTKAVLWDREQAAISISDSHSDFFIRNLIAILAELRAAFGVLQPSAFVEIDTAA